MLTFLTEPLPGIEARPADAHYAILRQGAHVLAWQPPGHHPVLWVSTRSGFQAGTPVRGGVPVVFPWFGKGTDGDRSPAHGYARITDWQFGAVTRTDNTLHTGYELAARDGHPAATLTADFGPEALRIKLAIINESAEPVTVEAALHTYFAVGDIRQVSIDGFDGSSYIDTVAGADPGPHLQHGPITFDGETDRLYRHEGVAVLRDASWDRTIIVAKTGSATTVVWNPWIAKAAAMADFGDDEWQQMVCIETANVRDTALLLAPGSTHIMEQLISVTG